jgi:hypothetical protein
MSILQKLTEGVVNRDMRQEGAALLNKWEKTGLLEGIGSDSAKNGMARLLENQAKQLLKEAASSMSGGDVEGFAAVAFPIVRRVFGGLIANDLVSVQPMSLPSGLIFFLDFTFGKTTNGLDGHARLGNLAGESLYGGGKVGSEITGGVNLAGDQGTSAGQFYNLTNGYSSPTASQTTAAGPSVPTVRYSGSFGANASDASLTGINGGALPQSQIDHINAILRYDADFISGSTAFCIAEVDASSLTGSNSTEFNTDDLVSLTLTGSNANTTHVRRLTQWSSSAGVTSDSILMVVLASNRADRRAAELEDDLAVGVQWTFPVADNFTNSSAIGSVVGQDAWGLEAEDDIPEINLKVDSVSVTAMTKKLKAKWTPELGQDLNAYHNLDAEVELTSLLSEQIALEIDREILEDLLKGATGGTYYWARSPGLFVNKTTGVEVGANSAAPDFTGTVSEWYETLGETINDVSAQIHRKTLRGGANFLVTSPEVANILEFTAGFRANVTSDDAKGTAGTQQVGTLSKRYDVFVDPYFPRNLVLIGRKGSSFLESGYVYAPYVPLQVTPTIFGVEDFVPRKGVMTRYAKKMVRPDMYGVVVVRGLLGESGA